MPIEMVVERESWRVVTTLRGRVDYDDIIRVIQFLFADGSGFEPDMNLLTMIEAGCRAELGYEHIESLAARIREHRDRRVGGGRTAVVAVDDESYGISRMLESMLAFDGREIMVFRNRQEAEAWLE